MHTLIPPINFYILYSIATPKHSKPLLLESHVCIVAFTPDLQGVSFYSIIRVPLLKLYHQAYIIPSIYIGIKL
jgi:hypothetical protein